MRPYTDIITNPTIREVSQPVSISISISKIQTQDHRAFPTAPLISFLPGKNSISLPMLVNLEPALPMA